VLAGAQGANGLLLQKLAAILGELEVVRAQDIVAGECFDPVAAAMLGQLYIDQAPANLPLLTGAETHRVLGRVTPGSPANWRKILQEMKRSEPATITLKRAV